MQSRRRILEKIARIKAVTSMLNDLRRPDTPRVVRRHPRG